MKLILDLEKLTLDVLLVLHKAKQITDEQLKAQLIHRGISDLDVLRIIRGNK